MARNSRGVTLVELMVAVAVMSVGILGFFGAFSFISKSLHVSRTRTLSTNLGQERIEALKNLSYYDLLITTASALDTRFTPALTYDTISYPPETISIGGVSFTRYTFVALAQIDNDVISTATYTYPDTGMKQIMVHVVWTDAGTAKRWTLTNLLENPNVNPLDASLAGTIDKAAGGALPGAVVKIEQNPDWNSTTDSSGGYSFRVYHGSYTVRASSAGFYDGVTTIQSLAAGSNTTMPTIALTAIATGTVAGNAWINSGLVISQIVAGTNTACADGSNHDVEYLELFNPTTAAVNIGQTGTYPKDVSVLYYDESSGFNRTDSATGFNFTHVSTFVPPGKYYLIANATSFVVFGSWINADAYYNTSSLYVNYIRRDKAGGLRLVASDGAILDTVGWEDNNNDAPVYEGSDLPLQSTDGLGTGKQVVRVSSPAAGDLANLTYGKAYDSDNNENDFLYDTISGYSGMNFPPSSTAGSAQTVIAGRPAVGASVAASDPYSGSTTAYTAYITSGSLSLRYAPFRLVGVTTSSSSGWTVEIASGTYYAQISTVVVSQNVTNSIPNAATAPSWPVSNNYSAMLTSSTVNGFIRGQVTDLNNNALSGLTVLAGGVTKTTSANGAYFASVSSGSVVVIANPNNANTSYIQSIAVVTVNTGEMTTSNFILSLGGSLQGYLTSGTTPLPNYVVTANIGGSQYGSGTSNTSGTFTIRNLSTGTYTVQPILDSAQDSSPNTISATVSSTGTVTIGTFTVSGAFGNIAGTVTNTAANELVTSGALVLASTSTISSTPPSLAASSSPALSPLYAVSSKADGSYILPVRGSNTYYLSVYVPTVAASGSVSITTKTYSSIYVSPALTTTKDVAIP